MGGQHRGERVVGQGVLRTLALLGRREHQEPHATCSAHSESRCAGDPLVRRGALRIAPNFGNNHGYSSSIPLGSLNWKSQLSEFSESAIKPSMLLAV
jgi:hypothetical protein